MCCITLNVVRFTISQSFDFASSIVHEGEGERDGTASSTLSQSRQRLLLIRRIHSLHRLVGPVWISKTLARPNSLRVELEPDAASLNSGLAIFPLAIHSHSILMYF
ncbi:hypothetical protein AAC387_Pa12g1076 [Persea americana]